MLSERLKTLRKRDGITQTEFAKEFNVSAGTIGNWETGAREPDYQTLLRIADFFGVSADYLLGHDENSSVTPAVTKFRELRIARGIQQKDLAIKLGVPANTYNQWETGKRDPDYQHLSKIADYFGVSVDYLLGREEKSSVPPAVSTDDEELIEYLEELKTRPEMRMLFSLSKNATKEDVEDAVRIIEALRKGRHS